MASNDIEIRLSVSGGQQAQKSIEKVENASADLKEGVKGVGENFKSVGDLVKAQGGMMGEAFGALGDSVIGITESVGLFKDGMSTAGAVGSKAWLQLLGPIAAIVSAISLAVEAYRQFSGASREAEEAAENMAAAASDTASRLEAMVEGGVVLSSEALKEFIAVNEKARLKIEETIKVNERRSKSEQDLKAARKALNEAENDWLFGAITRVKSQYDLNEAEREYNKLLEEQVRLQKEASEAQDEAFKLEQLRANDLTFFTDALKDQVEAYAALLEESIKAKGGKDAENQATLASLTLQRNYAEIIAQSSKAEKINSELLAKGVITRKAYDEATKQIKADVQKQTEALKEQYNTIAPLLNLEILGSKLSEAMGNMTVKVDKAFVGGIDARTSKMEQLSRVEKAYLANLSEELRLEMLIKETLVGGAEALQQRRKGDIDALAESMKARRAAYLDETKKDRDLLELRKNTVNELVDIEQVYLDKMRELLEALPFFENAKETRFKEMHAIMQKDIQDLMDAPYYAGTHLPPELARFDTSFPGAVEGYDLLNEEAKEMLEEGYKDIGDLEFTLAQARADLAKQNAKAVSDIYTEHYKNLQELSNTAYQTELKDLQDQERKLSKTRREAKANREELEQLEKKKVLLEQTFRAEQAKQILRFEQELVEGLLQNEIRALDEQRKVREEQAKKTLLQIDVEARKRKLLQESALHDEVETFKASRPVLMEVLLSSNAKVEEIMQNFNDKQELDTLTTEKKKADIEAEALKQRLNLLKEYVEETGAFSERIKNNVADVQLLPKIQLELSKFKPLAAKISELTEKILGEGVADFFFEKMSELDPSWFPPSGAGAGYKLAESILNYSREGLQFPEEMKKKLAAVEGEFVKTMKGFQDSGDRLYEMTGEIMTEGVDYIDASEQGRTKLEFMYQETISELAALREKYGIDPEKDVEKQLAVLREGYQKEQEALKLALEEKQLLVEDYNAKIEKSNRERAAREVEISRKEYQAVGDMLRDMYISQVQTISSGLGQIFYDESTDQKLKELESNRQAAMDQYKGDMKARADIEKQYLQQKRQIQAEDANMVSNLLKQTLRAAAQEALVKSIYHTGLGFGALAMGPLGGMSAAGHFKAAAIFAGLATLSGIASKAAGSGAAGAGASTSLSPTGASQTTSAPVREEAKNTEPIVFNINLAGATVYDTRQAAEQAMANRIMSLANRSVRGASNPFTR